MAVEEPIQINLELRNQFIERQGVISECYQCGTCTATCPLNDIKEEKFTVRSVLHKAQLGMSPDPIVWECSSCKLCEVRCPRQVKIVESLQTIRHLAMKNRMIPAELEQVLWNVLEESNPNGEPKSNRTKWMDGLNIPLVSENTDVLFYVGGPASYDPRLQKVSRALVEIMRLTNVSFGVIGKQEPASGETVRETGEAAYLDLLVTKNVEMFNKLGVNRIVVISPHSYDIMRNLYVDYGLEPEVIHYTQMLDELWQDNKLKFKKSKMPSTTYHDPCFLGRYNGVYDEPRNLIEAIPNVDFVEMDANRTNAICCGGGGNQMYRESEDGTRLSDIRVMEAAQTGAKNLVTTCGYCIQNFEDSNKVTNANVRILDLAELVQTSMRRK